MRQDIARNLDRGLSIYPASYTASKIGEAVSMVGKVDGVMVLIMIGAVAAADSTNFQTFTVYQCKTVDGTYTVADDVQMDWVEGDGILNATGKADSCMTMNFRFKKDYAYARIYATQTLTTEAIFGATFLKSGRHNPVAT